MHPLLVVPAVVPVLVLVTVTVLVVLDPVLILALVVATQEQVYVVKLKTCPAPQTTHFLTLTS